MTKNELKTILENMINNQDIVLRGEDTFSFTIRMQELKDSTVYIFGGWGTHFEIYQHLNCDDYPINTLEEIVDKFEEYISNYEDAKLKSLSIYIDDDKIAL